MDIRHFTEVSALHLEPDTYAKLLALVEMQPGRPGGLPFDPDDPWHNLIVEPHTYGCWVHTGIAEDDILDGLPASLAGVLREALVSRATYVLFDADLPPEPDLPVFEHPEPASAAPEARAFDGAPAQRVVFSFSVPVHVEVANGEVRRVTVIDETPVRDATLVEGHPGDLRRAVAAAVDGQDWPAWRFGY